MIVVNGSVSGTAIQTPSRLINPVRILPVPAKVIQRGLRIGVKHASS